MCLYFKDNDVIYDVYNEQEITDAHIFSKEIKT